MGWDQCSREFVQEFLGILENMSLEYWRCAFGMPRPVIPNANCLVKRARDYPHAVRRTRNGIDSWQLTMMRQLRTSIQGTAVNNTKLTAGSNSWLPTHRESEHGGSFWPPSWGFHGYFVWSSYLEGEPPKKCTNITRGQWCLSWFATVSRWLYRWRYATSPSRKY